MRHNDQITKTSIPLTICNYTFTTYIASGGSSEIFLAKSIKFGEIYVAKVITVDMKNMESQWKSFNAEVTALSHLNFPNIIRMYDHFRMANQFILILEHCPNGSLSDKITVNEGISKHLFLEYASQIIAALDFSHSKFIAHRDIKASNIFIDKYGRLKLSDFGLSIHAPHKMLQNSCCGSLLYTAPEIFSRKPNNPFLTDIWSLGVLFIVMLQGKSPWAATDREGMIQQIMKADYKLSDDFPEDFAEVIARMLVVDPDQRIKISELKSCQCLQPAFNLMAGKTYPSDTAIRHSRTIKLSVLTSDCLTHAGSSYLAHSTINISHCSRLKSAQKGPTNATFVDAC